MLIALRKSNGTLMPDLGGLYFGQSRPSDTVPVRSSVPVSVRFYDDSGNRTLLDRAVGVLTIASLPAAGDTFTVGSTTYTTVATEPASPANGVLLGVNIGQFIANLVGAINGATTNGQAAGTTYSVGTVANPLAYGTATSGSTVTISAWAADATGNTVATTTTSAHATFGAATLTGGQVLNLDIKPQSEYDADFTLPSPVFTAPMDPTMGDYTGTLFTTTSAAIALLEPNNLTLASPSATIEPDNDPLMAQLSWGAVGVPLQRSGKWIINLDNSIRHGNEATLTFGTLSFLATISSVGDSATASLEAMPTLGLTTPNLRVIYNVATDELQSWLLWPSTTAVTGPGVQLPNDYNALTNAKAWFRK